MLRRFAAVAPVPRAEDFGIDAICTLLREDNHKIRNRRVFAENTFAVQVKAGSSKPLKPLKITEETYNWLRQLDIPLFLLMVNLNSSFAKLYSYEWVVVCSAFPRFSLRIYTDIPKKLKSASDIQPYILSAATDKLGALLDPGSRWLGPPIASFALTDLVNDEKIASLYSLLKCWCECITKSIHFRRYGIEIDLTWEADMPPRERSIFSPTQRGDYHEALTAMVPLILKVELALRLEPNNSLVTTFPELEAMKKMAGELGINVPGFSLRPPKSQLASSGESPARSPSTSEPHPVRRDVPSLRRSRGARSGRSSRQRGTRRPQLPVSG
jgi:hypothetical protein